MAFKSFLLFSFFFYFLFVLLEAKPLNVSYDHRAILIDGKRQLLLSGCIHYPRSTPSMWPELFRRSKEAGLNVIQTYVFWNVHERERGHYDFETDFARLPQFLTFAQEAGLYVTLRIGPYVCAEWDFGGFPEWLKEIPGIVFRDYNEPFMNEMARWMKYLVNFLQPYFASNGGPIILAQVENEYKFLEPDFGSNGTKYAQWASQFANSLNIGIPWIMCQQDDVATSINTCNGFYCHDWLKQHWEHFPNQPGLWTENWPGWFQDWGQPEPSRPVEDVLFAEVLWFAYGGTHHNYYMWHGGTNFERFAGGPGITTNYDYDVALDEYGYPHEPKYSHSAKLHSILLKYQDALLQYDPPKPIPLGNKQSAFVYGTGANSLVFLINQDDKNGANVTFQNQNYLIPAWSATLLGGNQILFNTATITKSEISPSLIDPSTSSPEAISFSWFPEAIGTWGNQSQTFGQPHELISLTHDRTDYLWYTRSVQVTENKPILSLQAYDHVHVFLDKVYQGFGSGKVSLTLNTSPGTHELELLVMTIGLVNFGAHMEAYIRGLLGDITLNGVNLNQGRWIHTVGIQGEAEHYYTLDGYRHVKWINNSSYVNRPMTWLQSKFDNPKGDGPLAIDMTGMNKGFVWINGRGLGRYWLIGASGSCSQCDYRGNYNPDNCRVGCGRPSQNLYHIPDDWVEPNNNLLIIFEEIGGNPSNVIIKRLTGGTVCDSQSESNSVTVYLKCDPNTYIRSVDFASFGTPSGSCGSFQKGTCHASSSQSVVEKLCLGRSRCSVGPTIDNFGDPCPRTNKHLSVQVTCSK